MKTEFTKGEWKEGLTIYGNLKSKTIVSGNYCICAMNSYDPNNEQSANLKLIAAAPEMLEQLQSIADGSAFDDISGKIWRHRLDLINEVIKKATE